MLTVSHALEQLLSTTVDQKKDHQAGDGAVYLI
jgi:hypothetical protein